jgi:hypothetical protein
MSLIKKFNRFADRGADAEKETQKFLNDWGQYPFREFNRLVDSKAAGRTIKAAAADFEFFQAAHGTGPRGDEVRVSHGLIEVKETEHDYRLDKKRITQMARLRKRANCGGKCFVLVFHSKIGVWRCLDLAYMTAGGLEPKGSWDLRGQTGFMTPGEALGRACREVFL